MSKLVLAAGLGFAGGQAAVILDRRRKAKDVEAGKQADWQISHLKAATYELKNVGTAHAGSVVIEAENGRIVRNIPKTEFGPGESAGFVFARRGHSPQLMIVWTDHNGKLRGPIDRLVPARPDSA